MGLLIAFSVTLLVAVLISGLARRSVLSTAVLFLLVGLRQGETLFHLIAMVVGLSIILHSSSDVAIARHFRARESDEGPSPTVAASKTESERLKELVEPDRSA